MLFIVPFPIPDVWNKIPERKEEICYSHVFFRSPNTEDGRLEYLTSICCEWSESNRVIRQHLVNFGKGGSGAVVGIMIHSRGFPEMVPMDQFFTFEESFRAGRCGMILIVSSFQHCKIFDFKPFILISFLVTIKYQDEIISTENLPKIPLDIIHRCRVRARSNVDVNMASLLRRMIRCCISGGIPIEMLNLTEFNFLDLPVELFKRVQLNHQNATGIDRTLQDLITPHLLQAWNNLFNDSLESPLRSLFWDPVLNHLFNGQANLRIWPEWQVKKLFPRLSGRKMDYSVLFNLLGINLPIFVAEIGKDPFSLDSPHKDQSKQIGALNLICLKMAHELIRCGKDPEHARVYGLWIGGPVFQLCVAIPVVTKLIENGEEIWDIHIHVCFETDWIFDLALTTRPERRHANERIPDEQLIPGTLDTTPYPFLPTDAVNIIEDINIPTELPQTQVNRPRQTREATDRVFPQGVNQNALNVLAWFIKLAKKRVEFLLSCQADYRGPDRRFRENLPRGVIVQSTTGLTPLAQRPNQLFASLASVPSINYGTFPTERTSVAEFRVWLELVKFPEIFPILSNFEIREDGGKFIYEFEKMDGMFVDAEISSRLHCPTATESLFHCLLFGINGLYSLHMLHEEIGIVHSDISSSNIMFSPICNRWKVNDYDHSLPVDESLNRPRTAGTPGFIAPESEATGIFSKASDIYSFGTLMMKVIDPILLGQIYLLESDDEDSDAEEYVRQTRTLEPQAMGFTDVMMSMCRQNPSNRPTAIEALKRVYDIFMSNSTFSRNIDPNDFYFLTIRNELTKESIKILFNPFLLNLRRARSHLAANQFLSVQAKKMFYLHLNLSRQSDFLPHLQKKKSLLLKVAKVSNNKLLININTKFQVLFICCLMG